jgi:LacI family transcriptional regulator
MLVAAQRPSALIVTASNFMPAVLAGIKAAGARVPDDVSLICFGDSDWAQVIEPPLNVITIDLSAHLEEATRLLIGMTEKTPDASVSIEHPARYIRRGSVKALSSPSRRSRKGPPTVPEFVVP